MFRNKSVWVLAIVSVLFVAVCGLWIYDRMNKPKTGYIFIEEVFNAFDMKKEVQGKYESQKNQVQKMLDSLQFELQLMANRLNASKNPDKDEAMKFEQKRSELLTRKQKFEEDMTHLKNTYDKQIIERINQYASEFGKENDYTYIFGNDNNGSLMYAKDGENITPQVIEYINKKYQGQK